MAITVELAGVDRTSFVYYKAGLSYDDQVNGQGTASLTFIDQVGGGATITPTEGQTLVIKDAGTAVFSGILTNPEMSFLGPDAADQNALYKCTAVSKEYVLAKRLVWKTYTDTAFEDIVDDINTTFLSGEGLDGTTQVTAGSNHTITFNGETVAEALDELCAKEADGRTWYINTSDEIVIDVLSGTATPATLDPANGNVLLNPRPTKRTSKAGYANVVTVVGGSPDLQIAATRTNSGEITARAAAEGGSGRYEAKEENPDLKTQDQVDQRAIALLAEMDVLPTEITVRTRVSGFAPGQQGTVNLPNMGISSVTMYVTAVRHFAALNDAEFWHDVTLTTRTNPNGGYQTYYRNKKPPKTIPMQVTPADDSIVRVEVEAGPLCHDPTRDPGQWFQGTASGALSSTPSAMGIMHRRKPGVGSGLYWASLRRSGNTQVVETWLIDSTYVSATTVTKTFSWAEFAANSQFKDRLVISPNNVYAVGVQYGSPGKLFVCSIAGEGLMGSVNSNLSAQANTGRAAWVGNYVYIPNVSDGKVYIYDVSDVTAPTEVGSFTTSLSALYSILADSTGSTLYFIGTGGITAADISADPEAPGPSANSGSLALDIVAAAGTITRAAGDFTTDGFAAGQTILTSGFTNGGNNGYWTIDTVSALVITVTDSTGMVDESGSGDEVVDAIEDSAVSTTGSYVDAAIDENDAVIAAAVRQDASNVRVLTVGVSTSTLTLTAETSIALAQTVMAGYGALLLDGALIVFNQRNPTTANSLKAHVFDVTDTSAPTFTETLSYSSAAAGNLGPATSADGRTALYTYNSGSDSQITYGLEVYDKIVPYTIGAPAAGPISEQVLPVRFGGTGQGEYLPGNLLAATARATIDAIAPPTGANQKLSANFSESTLIKWEPNELFNVVEIDDTDSPYTVSDGDDRIPADTTSGAITVNLPALASSLHRELWVKNIGTGGNDVTIDGNSTEQIEGATTLVLSDGETALIVARATQWEVVAGSEAVVDDGTFFLLAGRSGGQTGYGGTGSGDDLTLHSTAHATLGTINLGDTLYVDEVNSRVYIGLTSSSATLHVRTAAVAGATVNPAANEMVLEGNSPGISVIGRDADYCYFMIGSPSDNLGAAFRHNYNAGETVVGNFTTNGYLALYAATTEIVRIDSTTHSMGLRTSSFGTNADAVFSHAKGTAPSSSPADVYQLYAADWNGAGTVAPHFRTEEGDVIILANQGALTASETGITHTAPGTPDYAIADLVDSGAGSAFGFSTKDEGNTVLQVIANLQTRVDELEAALQAMGILD